jgi:uncharacterized protein
MDFRFINAFWSAGKEGSGLMNRSIGKESGLIIRVSGLSNGLHEYHFSANPGEIGLNSNFHAPVEVDARLDKANHHLYLNAGIRTSGSFECDRCLDQFELPLTTRYTVVYLSSESEQGNYPPEEIQIIGPDTTSIDLTTEVHDMTLLSVPLKLLCRDDCRGLCPSCGTNLNRKQCGCATDTDTSRWSSLKKLLDQ